jgi:heptaprenyl diphosphate synthase
MSINSQNLKHDLGSIGFETTNLLEVDLIEREIYDALSDSKGTIREMCTYLLNAGGKRIRPLLVLHSGLAFSVPSGDLMKAAVAAELIHMATLAHDDIIDNSELRRNRLTLNKVWGNQFGVLCGDYLFSKAFGILSKNKLFRSLDFMVEAIDNMCSGEILQANNKYNNNMNLNMYYEQITKKTAMFLECCCKSGAFICGADETQMRAVGKYGLNIGLAFQIIDDILDFCGNAKVMGKPKGEDFRQGIITLPIILLLNDEKLRSPVREIISKNNCDERDCKVIYELLYSSGAIDQAYKIAAAHIATAQKCLKVLPDTSYKDSLYNLSELLKSREN